MSELDFYEEMELKRAVLKTDTKEINKLFGGLDDCLVKYKKRRCDHHKAIDHLTDLVLERCFEALNSLQYSTGSLGISVMSQFTNFLEKQYKKNNP